MIYRVSTLNRLAKIINPDFTVFFHSKDGWWLQNSKADIFLGSDSAGAYNKLIKIKNGHD